MRHKKNWGLHPTNTGFNGIIDEIFNSSFSDILQHDFVSTKPSVNILEESDAYKIEVAAPGLIKSDFNIELDHNQLTITVEKKDEKVEDSEDGTFSKREFNYNSFKRSFHISKDIEQDGIDAIYKNGILTINLKKREEAIEKEPSTIEIK